MRNCTPQRLCIGSQICIRTVSRRAQALAWRETPPQLRSNGTQGQLWDGVDFLTDFAAQVPEFEGPVMTSGNNTRIVQQELGRQHFAAVSRERVLGEKTQRGEPGDGTPPEPASQTPDS